MTWQLGSLGRKLYERNCLENVVCQIRFRPILKVEEKIADFQEVVRTKYPEYSVSAGRQINLFNGNIDVKEEKQFLFKKAGKADTIALVRDFIAFETKSYERRSVFLEDVKLGLQALAGTHKVVNPTRIGLRFVNAIDKEIISNDLGQPVSWSDLISEDFLAVPKKLASIDDASTYHEITSNIDDGKLILRYGIIRLPGDENPKFRFDVDRYTEGEIPFDQIVEKVSKFNEHALSLFSALVGAKLSEWLKEKKGDK